MSLSAKKPTRIKTTLKDEALSEIRKEDVSKFNANVPKALHMDFFVKCKRNGTTMTNEFIELIEFIH